MVYFEKSVIEITSSGAETDNFWGDFALKRTLGVLIFIFLATTGHAQTLAQGAIVCQTKESIKELQAALSSGDVKKQGELVSTGKCYRVEGEPHVAVTNACGPETRKILLNGEPVWCLSRHIR